MADVFSIDHVYKKISISPELAVNLCNYQYSIGDRSWISKTSVETLSSKYWSTEKMILKVYHNAEFFCLSI